MKYATKKVVMDIAYLLGISVTTFALGWMWGNYDTIEGIREGIKESNDETDDKPDHGRYEWVDKEEPDQDEKPAIEWAEGGKEEFYKALEEADKEEENESKS